MTEAELNARLDRVQTDFGDVLGAIRVEAANLLRLRGAVADFARGLVSLPELLELAKEPQE